MRYPVPGAVTVDAQQRSAGALEATRAFMGKVYGWMTAGMALTAGTALIVASTPALLRVVMPMFYPLMIAEVALVLAFSFLSRRVSGAVAALMFMAYAFLNGLTFSVLFLAYTGGSIAGAFASTALAFGGLTVYGAVTKRDLSPMRTFLVMGLWGIFFASIINIFMASGMLNFVLGCAGVLVFSGLTAYDNQKLRQMHAAYGDEKGTMAIHGALTLYLDFINLFISLLRLFGQRR
jgi:FtsH-binding integral membrane protein